MKDDLSEGNDLFDAIKRGNRWNAMSIEKIIVERCYSSSINHEMLFDEKEKLHYLYNDECFLIVYNGMIEVRCDRENVFSSNVSIEYPINNIDDIKTAYERFKFMIMEAEEEE